MLYLYSLLTDYSVLNVHFSNDFLKNANHHLPDIRKEHQEMIINFLNSKENNKITFELYDDGIYSCILVKSERIICSRFYLTIQKLEETHKEFTQNIEKILNIKLPVLIGHEG